MDELYDKIWEIIKTKVDDEVICDMLTDQIVDVINDKLQDEEV
jgi:hypothetical protein